MASKSNRAQMLNGNMASPEFSTEATEEWTVEAFQNAEPYPLPEVHEDKLEEYFAKLTSPSTKGGNTLAGGPPSDTTGDEDTDGDSQPLAGHPYPPPFNQHEVLAPYTTYPYCAVGKLFFNQKRPDGSVGSFVASAASIGGNGFWTAGHCVHSGNNQQDGWSTNLVFVPAYKDGAAPFGQFKMQRLFCRPGWYQKGNPGGFFEDMGAGLLLPLNNRKVSQVVGWLGFSWNFPRNQVWTSLGYPAGAPFNGMRMFQDTAPYANDGAVPGTPATIGIGCSMTGGCSGGPWVIGLGSTNNVNGHNSYRPNAQPLEIYSPYFGDNAHSLLQQVNM